MINALCECGPPLWEGAGGQRSLLICYADWLLSGCLSGCVCRVCVCVCCARVSLRRMFIHISNNTNRTEQTSRCQLPFIYLCLIIIKTGTVAKTMTILRPRHGIEIRIGIFISAFLFQIKKEGLLCMPWFVMYLWVPWFHFWSLKESAYEYNLISLRQWTIYSWQYGLAYNFHNGRFRFTADYAGHSKRSYQCTNCYFCYILFKV